MVAHVSFDRSATGTEITLEMWQIPNIEGETFYIHGIFLPSQCRFIHLDGATMYHGITMSTQSIGFSLKVKRPRATEKKNTSDSMGGSPWMMCVC